MDMIASHIKIQDAKAILFFSFKQSGYPFATIPGKLQQKLAFVASVGDVPDVARYVVSFGARHKDELP
jgi:hypothetical protein